jgi:hypothetical protein
MYENAWHTRIEHTAVKNRRTVPVFGKRNLQRSSAHEGTVNTS